MPRGLKETSSPITVSASATATTDAVAQQFSSKRIDLQLNPLDNEVFVVTGLKIDFTNPLANPDGAAPGFKTLTQRCSLSTGNQTVYAGIESSNVIGASQIDATSNLSPDLKYYMALEQNSMDAPPATMDYLHVIATNDFFVNFQVSTQYASAQDVGVSVRLFGYRAKADSSTYAALVQSELLSQ